MAFTPNIRPQYEICKVDIRPGRNLEQSISITKATLDEIVNSAHIVAYRKLGETTWKEVEKNKHLVRGE